jgi:hypothetical protein
MSLTVSYASGNNSANRHFTVAPCPSTATGNTCTLQVTFSPQAVGLVSDTIYLSYNGGPTLPPIQVQGTGQAASTINDTPAGGGALSGLHLALLALLVLVAAQVRRRLIARRG